MCKLVEPDPGNTFTVNEHVDKINSAPNAFIVAVTRAHIIYFTCVHTNFAASSELSTHLLIEK